MELVAALESEGHAKEEVANDEEADLLEVVDPLVVHHEVQEPGQVGHGDEDEVQREGDERVRDECS